MISLLTLVLVAVGAESDASIPAGNRIVVKGSFDAKKPSDKSGRKDFQLQMLVEESTPQGLAVAWTLEERGAGSWSWVDHFGRVTIRPNGTADGASPSLSFERNDGDYAIAIPLPISVFDKTPAVGLKWMEGRLQHEVTEEESTKEGNRWKVEVRGPIGIRRTYSIDKSSPRIVNLTETVFVGQGEEHRLTYATAINKVQDADSLSIRSVVDRLEQLRDKLKIEPRKAHRVWSTEQLASLRETLPELAKSNESDFVRSIVAEMETDAREQKDRAGAMVAMRDKIVGAAAPTFELSDTDGSVVNAKEFSGKVLVLHFWEYRDAPLKEPYGQSAYLDFLSRNIRGKGQVRVLGIAVDPRFGEPDGRSRALQSVRKFNAFMNLSYPVLLDSGSVIKRFGDPRTAGARLPLFVVIDPSGKVVHFHAGEYDIAPNRGLEELEAVIKKALGNGG